MQPILFLIWLSLLPIGSGVINCRIACRRCREKVDHPDMLEVYCAMCEECKERRREWLEGAPSLLRVEKDEDYLTNYGQQEQDDCTSTTPIDENCDKPIPLKKTIQLTTTTTTTSTTTTTTTRKPCRPKPCIKPTRPTCPGLVCPIPMAIPLCQMCPMQVAGSSTTPLPAVSETTTEFIVNKLSGVSPSTSELYFYLGVPKKLLKQLQLSRS